MVGEEAVVEKEVVVEEEVVEKGWWRRTSLQAAAQL